MASLWQQNCNCLLWQELQIAILKVVSVTSRVYCMEEADVHLSGFWWTIEGVYGMWCTKSERCIALLCKQLARDKRAFDCVAAAGARESFWKIMTNTTLSASQVEPCPLFDLCPCRLPLDLHLLTDYTRVNFAAILWGKDQIKGKMTFKTESILRCWLIMSWRSKHLLWK